MAPHLLCKKGASMFAAVARNTFISGFGLKFC